MMKTAIAGMLTLALTAGAVPQLMADDYEDYTVARLLIKQSGITAEKAIDIAKKTYDGVVYQYELEDEDDQFVHEIKLINIDKNEEYKVEVDAQSGMVVKETTKRAQGWFENDEKLMAAKAIKSSGFTVKDAISKVRTDGDMLILEVEYEHKQGIQFFEVETFSQNGEQKWLVDIDQKSIIPGFKRHH